MIKRVKRELAQSHLVVVKSSQLVDIAKPIAHQLLMLKPKLINKLDTYVPLRLSPTQTLVVFVGNLALHILAMYLYHRFEIFKWLIPNFLEFGEDAMPLKHVMTIPDQHTNQLKKHAMKINGRRYGKVTGTVQ